MKKNAQQGAALDGDSATLAAAELVVSCKEEETEWIIPS